jgi:hypothetical protein
MDITWILDTLKEARDNEDWDLVKAIILYITEYEEFADDDDDWDD